MSHFPTTEIQTLVDKFTAGIDYYTAYQEKYLEADVRGEFIDPFLAALGWDIQNGQALIPSKREVVREEGQQREGSADKRPDYTLRVLGSGRVYVEAKKPSVNILNDMDAIRQTRAYGWTKQHPIAVLTNFRHIRIFDTSVPINPDDTANTALRFECEYREIPENWEMIQQLIGRDAVHEPDWINQFNSVLAKAQLPADKRFVAQLNQWRLDLGESIIVGNPSLAEVDLNDAVQRILNRLVFVRMCEDRGIEGEGVLREAFQGDTTDISDFFSRLNRRYNTGIFRDADELHDPMLLVSAATLESIVDHLYAPYSPFSFAVLDADFLGLVYEASLAEHLTIKIVDGQRAVELNKKREYAKRDVVTTPQELVVGTVRAAVEELEVDEPKVLDFAVGSGRFLVSVFGELIEREVVRRAALTGRPGLLKIADNSYRLAFEVKRRILANCCFGIDIDFNAVEVARFSLLVHLLEDETFETLPKGSRNILPNLAENIIHGNTLVRAMPIKAPAGAEELTQPISFVQVGIPTSFDLIVGNPPYMSTEQMKSYDKWEFEYIKANYKTPYQQFDKYFAFVEFAVKHLNGDGVLGVVIPNKWMTIEAAPQFRYMLRNEVTVRRLANFRHVQVFEDKSIYVCALVAKRAPSTDFAYTEPTSIFDYVTGDAIHRTLSSRHLPPEPANPWVLAADATEERVLAKIHESSIPLGHVVEARNGVQTSLNSVYVISRPKIENGIVEFNKGGVVWQIEEAATRPYLDNSVGVRSHFEVKADARIIYPYRISSSAQNQTGFEVIPECDMCNQFPLAYKYLVAHRDLMDKRKIPQKEREKAFYVYGRVQAIAYCADAPKIFYSANQRGNKYGFDTTGIVYQSGGTAGEVALYPRDLGYSLDFVLAVLDQRPIEFFLRKRGSAFRGGYVSRGTAVIADVPVPRLDFDDADDVSFHDEVAERTVALRALHAQTASMPERRLTQHTAKIGVVSQEIEHLFLSRWGISLQDVADLRI